MIATILLCPRFPYLSPGLVALPFDNRLLLV